MVHLWCLDAAATMSSVKLHIVGTFGSVLTGKLWAIDDDGRAWYGSRTSEHVGLTDCQVHMTSLEWKRASPSRTPKYLYDNDPVVTIDIQQ